MLSLRVSHVSDMRGGHRLLWKKNISDNDDEKDEDYEYDYNDLTIEKTNDAKYDVLYLQYNIGIANTKLLRVFDSLDAARQFCKDQYFHATHSYPFIVDGITGGYKSTGDREKFEVKSPNMLPELGWDDCHHILIVGDDYFETHCLMDDAEW